jgi:protein gp37
MNKTNIEYLDYTWNPIAMRCTTCSPGCDHCWHLRMCDRMKNNPKIPMDQRMAYAGDGPPVLTDRLHERFNARRAAAHVGVQFMGDLLHESVPTEYIHRVLSACHYAPNRHNFLFLTKRPERIVSEFSDTSGGGFFTTNMWLGVSVCNQYEVWKIGELLKVPATRHWVSVSRCWGPSKYLNISHIRTSAPGRVGTEWPKIRRML